MSLPDREPTAIREHAGALADGTPVEAIRLSSASGVSTRILTFGATLQSLLAPDRNGIVGEITLGFDDVTGYARNRSFFGVTVGRYANRIAGARFTLDGAGYRLPANDGPNSLHGGDRGFDQRNWTIAAVSSSAGAASAVLTLASPDGDMGYPGNLDVRVTYSLDETGALSIAFEASADRSTIVNLTNHALFNLTGDDAAGGALTHKLTIPASHILPVDEALVPTGEKCSVEGTVFDFRAGRQVGDGIRDGRDSQILRGRGYDHNFVLDKGQTETPRLAARLESEQSGRVVEVLTTEPGLQLYTGNFLDGTVSGRGGRLYRMGDGIALEPQKFPDTPNRPAFGSARLDAGQTYRHLMVYKLAVVP